MADIELDEHFVVDTPASTRFPVYTRANVSDVWVGPATPLTYTTQAGMLFENAWRDALVRFGAFDRDEFAPHQELIGVLWGYTYLNLSAQRVFGARMPGVTPELIDSSFFGGGTDNVPPYEADPRDESPQHTERIGKTIEWVLTVDSLPKLDEDRSRVAGLRAQRPEFATLSNRELLDYAEPYLTTTNAELMAEHMFITAVGSVPIGMVQAVAASIGEPNLAMRALAGLGNVDSAAPVWAMWDLSRMAASSPTLTAAFQDGVGGLLDRLRAADDADANAFLAAFDQFLRDFGSRCPNEWDISAPSWESAPELPLTAIDRMRLQSDGDSPQHGFERLAADREAVTEHIVGKLASDPAAQGQFRAALKAAALFLPARERTKTTVILQLQEARMAIQELARRLTEAGHLDRPEDIVMLKFDEFPAYLQDPAVMADEVRHRRRWFDELAKYEPPFITVGYPSPPSTWRRREVKDLPTATKGEVFTGIAACPGTATGTARVILDPADGCRLEPGDILVTAATDPSWTPLFIAVHAVVVDVGAPLSHAAIVSRELGVPCVVSATNASRRIPDGATITVDGTSGTVTVDEV